MAFLTLATGMASAAYAQSTPGGGNVAVRDRARPGYDALGVRQGAFMIYPRLTLRVDHGDNIFASSTNQVSDTIYTATPEISAQSDWSRHALSANARFDAVRHADVTSEDSNAWSVRTSGRLDISRTAKLTVNAAVAETLESRAVVAYDETPIDPVTFQTRTASASLSKTFSRLSLKGGVDFADYDYDDTRDVTGDVIENSSRDHNQVGANLRAAYAVSPSTAVFVEGGFDSAKYDSDDEFDRDGQGRSVLVGVDTEITRLITGEAAIGYLHHDFDDPALEDVETTNYRLALQWFPTQLITVGLTGSQRVTDSPLPETPEVLVRSIGLTADYELLRNLIVSAQLSAARDDYRGADRRDDRFAGAIGVNYLVNRTVGVSLRYRRQERWSSGADSGGEFTDNTFGIALVLQR